MTTKEYYRDCSVCRIPFSTRRSRQHICSKECRKLSQKETSLVHQIRKDQPGETRDFCVVCGFNETIDIHHEYRQTYFLCPNHHALITRGIKTLNQLISVDYSSFPPSFPQRSSWQERSSSDIIQAIKSQKIREF